jgi:hypothetical protein
MADLAKMKFQFGDNLWVMLDKAGAKPIDILKQLERIARANGTTVKTLEKLPPGAQLWVPQDIASGLPPDRMLAFHEGAARASDATARRAAVIRRHANDALRQVLKGYVLQEEVVGGGFRFTATWERMNLVIDLQTPKKMNAWIDPGTVRMLSTTSGLSATVELAPREPARSISDCKAKLDAVHEYARTLEDDAPAMPVVIAPADASSASLTDEPAPTGPPPALAAAPAALPAAVVPPPAVVEAPVAPPPVVAPPVVAPSPPPPVVAPPVLVPPAVVKPKKPRKPPSPAVQMAAIVGLTLALGLGLGWILFH